MISDRIPVALDRARGVARKNLAAFGVGMVAVLAVGCGNSSPTTSSSASSTPILVGVDMSQTGVFAPIGSSEVRGIQLAVNQINGSGGIGGRKINLEILDDGSDPTRAVTNVRTLIGDGAVAILGPTTGSTLGGTLPLTTRQNIPQLVGVGPDFAGASTVPSNLFTVPPPLNVWLSYATCYLKSINAKKVAGLFTPDAAGSRSQETFPAVLQAAGIQLVSSQQVALTATDTTVQWTQVRSSNPDAVLDWMTGAVGGTSLKDAKALGISAPIIGYVSWGLPSVLKVAGPAADGALVIGHIAPSDPTPQQKPFVDAFQKAYPDQTLDHFTAYAYDMTNLLANALKTKPNATQSDGPALVKALETAKATRGVVADYHFSSPSNGIGAHSGVTVKDITLLVARGGQFYRNPQQPKCS